MRERKKEFLSTNLFKLTVRYEETIKLYCIFVIWLEKKNITDFV